MVYTNSTAVPRDELTDIVMESETSPDEFAGINILPPYPVSQLTAHLPKITIAKGNLMRATSKLRSPGSNFDRWTSAVEDANMTLVQIGEEIAIPDEDSMQYEDYFDLEATYSMEAKNRLTRAIEIDSVGALFNSTTFDAVNGSVAYSKANLATIAGVADILDAIRRVKARGERPNTLVIPGPIYDRIRQSADMRAWITGSVNPGAAISPDAISASFLKQGITNIWVAESYVNTAADSDTPVLDPIWPLTYIFVGKVASGQLKAGGVGRTAYWDKEGPLFNVSSYRDEPKKSNIIRGMKTTAPVITNARAGTLIATQVTS